MIKIYFQPDVQVDLAMAQVTSLSQSILKNLPSGILPPQILKYDASSVPIVQLSLGGRGLSQEELYDYGQNFIRTQLENIKGACLPLPYGGEVRSIMVDVDPTQLAAYHLTTSEVSSALRNQNIIAPSGTEKIGDREYLIGTNAGSSRIYEAGLQFNLPIQNRVAQADLHADQVQLQQQRMRLTQLETQVSAEVRNALIGLKAAKQAAEAAAASRRLQEQLLAAEQDKFQAERATNFSVIQQQAYLAQAQVTEIIAKAAWNKAAAQLARASGQTLEENGIDLKPYGGK